MPRKLTFRQLLLSILALWHDVSQKEMAAAAGMSQSRVSQHLSRERGGEIKDEDFERLLAALKAKPAEVRLVTACLEGLDALEASEDLTEEERAEIEEAALAAARFAREGLTEAVRRSRTVPVEAYPEPQQVKVARRRAEEQWRLLADLPSEARLAVVSVAAEFQNWALCERICAESTQRASRSVEEAADLARLAEAIAEQVRGPEGWRLRVQSYASAHGANALRVAGELRAAEAGLERARRLWHAGSDPHGLLDPGRLLDLEASLRRDQRHFAEALALLDQAAAVGRSPGRVLIKKGFTLEVLGEYERAIEALLRAAPLVERQGDSRLLYMQRFNLAVLCCHLGRFSEATELLDQVRDLVTERGDAIELNRVTWLEGRIAAGLGRPHEALRLLRQARERFAAERMSYDVALALLEEAVLLLDQGRAAEVKVLAQELTEVFQSKGVHREALAALRLFKDAADQETATAALARRVLAYLFRARHDHGLRFES
ncbi:MAG TPA: tetratricopeptide repeat protein [Thermoanaerobaculia bacterium]|jgi:tetratricopeptide (TPR) repeat protein